MYPGDSVCEIVVFSSNVLDCAVKCYEKILPSLELLAISCLLYEDEKAFVISQDYKVASSQLGFKKMYTVDNREQFFWKVEHLSYAGLNLQLWKQDGLIVSRVPSPIHDPSPTSVASHVRYFGSLDYLFQSLKISEEFMSCFNLLEA